MTGAPTALLDACVLVNFSLCDTLLRLAEPPGLFQPRWSEEILRETTRTLEVKLGWPVSLTAHFQSELRLHFREAWIEQYESLIPAMANDSKDRHVLAAAVQGKVPLIVTFNLRHFKPEHLTCWGVRAVHPQSFLVHLFHQNPQTVLERLAEQAARRQRSLRQLLKILSVSVPEFSAVAARSTGIL